MDQSTVELNGCMLEAMDDEIKPHFMDMTILLMSVEDIARDLEVEVDEARLITLRDDFPKASDESPRYWYAYEVGGWVCRVGWLSRAREESGELMGDADGVS